MILIGFKYIIFVNILIINEIKSYILIFEFVKIDNPITKSINISFYECINIRKNYRSLYNRPI